MSPLLSSLFSLFLICVINSKVITNKSLRHQLPFTHAVHPEATLPFIDYCNYFSYPVESHRVTTQDGYILTLNRIQRKYSSISPNLPVVLLMHGLLDSSDGAVINDESKSPAFMLANLGYDVWSGNARGNKYSRSHVKYDPDNDREFWDFSWDDIAAYDLPVFFDYVTKATGQQKIDYMGHSQGTTVMFAALADKNPVVTQHLGKFIALGPVAYVFHQSSKPMQILSDSRLLDLLNYLNLDEFSPSDWLQKSVWKIICAQFGNICVDLLGSFSDADPSRDNMERADVFVGHFPSGTSLKNVYKWQQEILVDAFQKFDYGAEENLRRYGQTVPPPYNLGNIEHKVYLFSASEDLLSNPTDVQRLKDELKDAELKIYPKMGHLTFMVGQDMSFMNDVILALQEK